MPEEPRDEGFTVVDRRGRRDMPAAESAPAGESGTRPQEPVSAPASAFAASDQPDLGTLFLMLASSALVHLGAAPDPMSGAKRRDLAQARLSIDLLRLLREKTEGHRTAEESQLLDEVLYNLQLQFVEATGGPSRPG